MCRGLRGAVENADEPGATRSPEGGAAKPRGQRYRVPPRQPSPLTAHLEVSAASRTRCWHLRGPP